MWLSLAKLTQLSVYMNYTSPYGTRLTQNSETGTKFVGYMNYTSPYGTRLTQNSETGTTLANYMNYMNYTSPYENTAGVEP